jgi:hypothetical protein
MTVQGIEVPKAVVDPKSFFANARRQRFTQASSGAFNGLGGADTFSLKQSGIIGAIDVRLFGSVVVAIGTGTVASTSRWPYGLLKRAKVSANNMSNLVNAGGRFLKARELARNPGLTDRGVTRGIGAASPGTQVPQGTMSLNNEAWGIGQNVSAVPTATYNFDISVRLPIAFDLELLGGALFAQTSATDLIVELDYETLANLFTLTGNAAVTVNCAYFVDGVFFNIPRGPGGEIVLPDLSVFHTFVQSNNTTLATGVLTDVLLSGQGVGKQLLAVFWSLFGNGNNNTPFPVTDTNFGQLDWAYGGLEVPEIYPGGSTLAKENERNYGSDLATLQGIGVFDWANHWAFRDSIDMGSATQLRMQIQAQQALTNGNLEYAQEVIVPGTAAGTVGAASSV